MDIYIQHPLELHDYEERFLADESANRSRVDVIIVNSTVGANLFLFSAVVDSVSIIFNEMKNVQSLILFYVGGTKNENLVNKFHVRALFQLQTNKPLPAKFK